MIKMKRLAALGLAGVMSLGLLTMAGCDNSGNENGNGGSDGDITITMMYSGTAAENDFETEVLPDLVHEAFPNITLEVTKLPDDQYYTALKTKLASGECPDIILVQPMYAGANSVFGLAEAGYLEPLTDMKAIELSGVGASSFTYNGEVYGIPSGVTMLGTYYNADMLAKYNLAVPTTWDEFLNVCKTLKDNGITPIVMGDKDMFVMQFGLYQIACSEIYAANPDYDKQLRTGETKFNDEGTWDKVLSMYTTLYDNGYIDSSSLGLGSAQAIQKFIDGEAAMIFDGSFDYAAVVDAKGAVDFTRGYFPLPASNGDTYAAMAPGAGPAIYSGSQYKDECKAILEMLYDGESDMYKAYVDSGRIIPTYGYGYDQVNPIYDKFMSLYEEGKAFYWCNQAWPAGTEEEMESKLSEYIGKQGTTVNDITKAMQAKFDELLAASK
ncbi:MAG: extracellular solute-binding protein [Lachnospiraceae bacterium]|nr:extracellular solute-binding protein [Lachnospiraceae bacterium]